MMSDNLAATSVINSVLGATVSGFSHVGDLEMLDPAIIEDPEPSGGVYFHGKTNDGDVMIVFVVQWDYCFCSDRLFSNDPSFAVPEFADGRDLRARAPELLEWRGALTAVYIVQLVHYETRASERCMHVESARYFRVRREFDEAGIDVVHRIEVQLPRINVRFPVEAEIGLGWAPVDWWYFVFKFADRFSEAELRRCRGLGMPEAVISGLCQLDQQFWGDELRQDYVSEFQATASLRDRERKRLLGESNADGSEGWERAQFRLK
jgi:hypothetical protein